MTTAIDVWLNVPMFGEQQEIENAPQLLEFKGGDLARSGRVQSIDDLVAMMDEAGVEVALLAPQQQGHGFRMWPGRPNPRQTLSVSWKAVIPYLEKYPRRFGGLYGINPWLMMDAMKEMEMVVKEYGFVGALTHVAGFAPFNDKIWFPFYAKCVELDIPLISQIGHFAEPVPEAYGHPLLVDEVAGIFPELKLIAGHTGWPWCDVLQGIVLKHPNVYFSMEAHMPKYWQPSMVKFINSRGMDRGMWGSDWPIIEPKPSLAQVEDLGLKEEAKRKLLRENAIRIFKLENL